MLGATDSSVETDVTIELVSRLKIATGSAHEELTFLIDVANNDTDLGAEFMTLTRALVVLLSFVKVLVADTLASR